LRADAGALQVLYGSPSGLVGRYGNQVWHQDVSGIVDAAELGDLFGFAVTASDFNGDGRADLGGVAFEDIDGIANAGAVQVI
jgi:hypothetical protein